MVRRLLLFAVACSLSAGAPAGELLVLRSDEPGLAAGTIIDGTAPVRVGNGNTVVLVAEDGRKLRISGPYDAPPDAGAVPGSDSILQTLARMLKGSDTRLAVFRGGPRASSVQLIVLDRDVTRCVSSDATLRFRRLDTGGSAELSLTRSNGESSRLAWPPGTRDLDWPEALPYEAGARYTAALDHGSRQVRTRLLTLPDHLPSQAHAVAWMAEQGCERDAQRALGKLSR